MLEITGELLQIDCNNPTVDRCVVAVIDDDGRESVVLGAGRILTRDYLDNVPYSCPLTLTVESAERSVANFARACSDCSHSYISSLPI